MNTEKINVTVENGVKTLDIRHGELNKIHIPRALVVEGAAIGSVFEYLSKKGIDPDEIENSAVSFSYEELYLKLSFAVRREAQPDRIEGKLKLHPDLDLWQINKAKKYTNQELSDFIKMNRHYFDNTDTAMKLVSELRSLKVKTEKELENADNRQGDYRMVIGQRVIESNIPKDFILKLPVFVGTDPVSVNVEIEVSASDFGCTLISPDLKKMIDLETRVLIDAELAKIRELYPELRIFQK